mmetsp:Transcript_12053/g.34448  ORF Transcript_12053/g.34448 Transcript_12053/m.34448 type:complete len:219 (+) Transcript_12053:176-832(+)
MASAIEMGSWSDGAGDAGTARIDAGGGACGSGSSAAAGSGGNGAAGMTSDGAASSNTTAGAGTRGRANAGGGADLDNSPLSVRGAVMIELFKSSHMEVVVSTQPGSGASKLLLPGNDSQRTWPLRSSRCTRNLYSMTLLVGKLSAADDHTGKVPEFVVIGTALSGFQLPRTSPLPRTNTASPGRVAWQFTLKITSAIASVREGGRHSPMRASVCGNPA